MSKLIILRGIPGCGKSTVTRLLYPDCLVVSADEYFMDEGFYRFRPEEIGQAHAYCFRRTIEFAQALATMTEDVSVVVDNTNATVAEIAPYVALANAYGLDHEIVTIACDPEIGAARNQHSVSLETVAKIHENLMAAVFPPWWNHRVLAHDMA